MSERRKISTFLLFYFFHDINELNFLSVVTLRLRLLLLSTGTQLNANWVIFSRRLLLPKIVSKKRRRFNEKRTTEEGKAVINFLLCSNFSTSILDDKSLNLLSERRKDLINILKSIFLTLSVRRVWKTIQTVTRWIISLIKKLHQPFLDSTSSKLQMIDVKYLLHNKGGAKKFNWITFH